VMQNPKQIPHYEITTRISPIIPICSRSRQVGMESLYPTRNCPRSQRRPLPEETIPIANQPIILL